MHVWYSFPVFVLNSFLHRFKNLGYLKVFKLNGLIKIEMYMDMIRPNHLFFQILATELLFSPCFILTGMFSCTAAYILTKACSVVLMKEQEEEVRRIVCVKVAAMRWGDISDLTSQSSVWSGWRQLVVLHPLSHYFFFLPGSFALNDVAVTTPVVHKHTDWHLQEGRKKKPYASWFHLLTHTHWCTHSAPPLLVLSPPRGTEIFLSPVKP